MKKKFYLIAVIVFAISCLCFAACSKPHIHTYAEAWSKDQDYHWHEPLCSDAERNKEAHNFIGNECGTCGYIKEDEKDKNTGENEEKTPETNSDDESKVPSEQKPNDENKDPSEQKPSETTPEKTPESEERVSEAMLMYREAVENGYKGSYLEFLSEFKDIIGARLENSAADRAMLSVVSIAAYFKISNNSEAPASGAGVIFKLDKTSYDAYILTNYHVIYNADTQSKHCTKIVVWLYGSENESEALSAELLGGAIDKDIAVLEIKGSETVTAPNGTKHTNREILEKSAAREITIGDSDELSVGDTVYVIGNPQGFGTSVTRGVVSVKSEYKQMPALDTTQNDLYSNPYGVKMINILAMRVDAAINHGNSGGGLFNAFGEYVGTVNAREETEGIVAFGYAIPSNLTVAIANKIIESSDHKATHANFGFTVTSYESQSVYENGAARVRQTVVVANVSQNQNNSATENGEKLKSGDEFISYQINDGEEIEIVSDYQLSNASYMLNVGDKFTMKVKRGDKIVTITYLQLEEKDFATDRDK